MNRVAPRRPAGFTRQALSAALLLAALTLAGPPARAGEFQDDIQSRWRGAWVVTTVESYSDCDAVFTGNRVDGRLVSGHGRVRFRPGELAKVDSIDLHRSRLDLRLTIAEPILAPYQDGPFTLLDEARCRMEMQVELPRSDVKEHDLGAVESLVRPILERYPDEDQARASRAYNRREREPYPRDYERTVQAHAVWKAQQTNAAVQAQIERLVDETARIPDRINDDPQYLAGFLKGIDSGRAPHPTGCSDLLAISAPQQEASRSYGGYGGRGVAPASGHGPNQEGEGRDRQARGYQDGYRLAIGLDAVHRLSGCFVQVPDGPMPGPPAGR